MKELLERWAKAEPERCQPPQWSGGARVSLGPTNGFGPQHPVGRQDDPVGLALLQAAAQEAIEARGWMGVIGFGGSKGADARVVTSNDDDGTDAHGSTPAEALLSAYLTALEAQG
jgi:hypothetical protein